MLHFTYRYAECHYAECNYAKCRDAETHYAECCYAECHYAKCSGARKKHGENVKLTNTTAYLFKWQLSQQKWHHNTQHKDIQQNDTRHSA